MGNDVDIIQQVFDMSEVILASEPKSVRINRTYINELAEQMKKDGKYVFEPQSYKTGIHNDVLKELVACSINYCYWYGAHDIRPNGVSSTSLYNDVNKAFTISQDFNEKIYHLIMLLSTHRYPLLEERKRHLLELCENRKAEIFVDMVCNKSYTGERLFHEMIEMFQGFASDNFLKRASLFFIQLNRKFGWWEDDLMTILHVPADYQVPKVLRHFGCINYSPDLSFEITKSRLIPKHSLDELQIRAATVKVCTMLQYAIGWTIADVDTYLWGRRKLTDMPFHLTITTDY